MLFGFAVLIFWVDLLVVTYSNISEHFHDTNVLEAFKPQRLSTKELLSSKQVGRGGYWALVNSQALLLLEPTAELDWDVLPVRVSENAILI